MKNLFQSLPSSFGDSEYLPVKFSFFDLSVFRKLTARFKISDERNTFFVLRPSCFSLITLFLYLTSSAKTDTGLCIEDPSHLLADLLT